MVGPVSSRAAGTDGPVLQGGVLPQPLSSPLQRASLRDRETQESCREIRVGLRTVSRRVLSDSQNPEPVDNGKTGSQGFANLRLGALLSHGAKFVGGLDVTLTQVRLLPGLTTRIDGDLFAPFNSRRYKDSPRTRLGITFDQIYAGPLSARNRIYGGVGIGPYIGTGPRVVRFGGKVFLGGYFSSVLGAELGVHFPNSDDAIVTLEARIAL